MLKEVDAMKFCSGRARSIFEIQNLKFGNFELLIKNLVLKLHANRTN